MEGDMASILAMLIHWLNNYFTISETEKDELELASKIAIDKASYNFQHSDNKYFTRGGV